MSTNTGGLQQDINARDGVILLQALIHQRAGDGDAALRCLGLLRSEPVAGLARSLSQTLHERDAAAALRMSRQWLTTETCAGLDTAPVISSQRRIILRQVADGASNRQIARRLRLSENTVKWHLKEIYALLGVRNRCAATKKARLLSLIN